MKGDLEKEIMKIIKEKQVSNKSEFLRELPDKRIGKVALRKALEKLVEKKWIIPLYGSTTTFVITQKGIRETK